MKPFCWIWSSTGKKFLMAFSGLMLFGFIISHLLGNLQLFLGPEAMNRYAAFLKGTGELLWVARFGLLAMVAIHIWTAISLTLENRRARPIAYAKKNYLEASYASRTMHVSGLIVLFYLVYHLLHFTVRNVHPQYGHFIDPYGRHDVYSMVVLSFQQPLISIFYIIGNFLLATHLSHGIYSMFQSLGFVGETVRPRLKLFAKVCGYLIFVGFASMPVAVLLGIVKLPSWVTP